jgi:hypothetical protein
LQSDVPDKLYTVRYDYVSKGVVSNKNRAKTWQYGYNEKYDMVVISKSGQIGDIIEINGLVIALPLAPKDLPKGKNKWVREELPKALSRVQSIFQWNDMPKAFKAQWVDYIESEFDRREEGHWFVNGGVPTYITGAHYMYLQWTSIDVGYPDYREANRIFFIFWEACKADPRSFGMVYLKIRRSGFSFMGSGLRSASTQEL